MRRKFAFLVIVLLFISILGCSTDKSELKPLKLKLKWLHQAQFAGNYVAKEKGFYADEGLDVEIIPFSFEEPTIDAVIDGNADFGITGADELVLARIKGNPIKAIAVIYRINPVCAYSIKGSGIKSPYDFVGKKVGLEKGINVEYIYQVMMSKLDIDRNNITELSIGYDASELIEGKTDVSTGYIINEPHQAIEAGYDINSFLMEEYGVNMYADVLFTTDEMIRENPELVLKFVKGTIKGWSYSIENKEEAINYTLKYTTNRTWSHEMYMLKESIPLIYITEQKFGVMEENKWANIIETLEEAGKLVDCDVNVHDLYTNDFLEKAYSLIEHEEVLR